MFALTAFHMKQARHFHAKTVTEQGFLPPSTQRPVPQCLNVRDQRGRVRAPVAAIRGTSGAVRLGVLRLP
jgi:hypothetical protein